MPENSLANYTHLSKLIVCNALQLPQAGADTSGEVSQRNEIPTLTVDMPVMQADMLGHSGSSAGAQAATANRMVKL